MRLYWIHAVIVGLAMPLATLPTAKAADDAKLQWGDAVNGLRAALAIRPASGEPKSDDALDLYLVVQNVSDAPIRLIDTDPMPKRRDLLFKSDGRIQMSMVFPDPTRTDVVLQPKAFAYVRMFPTDSKSSDGQRVGSVVTEGLRKDTHQTLVAEWKIELAPAGAWTGKLVTGETNGADASSLRDKDPTPKAHRR